MCPKDLERNMNGFVCEVSDSLHIANVVSNVCELKYTQVCCGARHKRSHIHTQTHIQLLKIAQTHRRTGIFCGKQKARPQARYTHTHTQTYRHTDAEKMHTSNVL